MVAVFGTGFLSLAKVGMLPGGGNIWVEIAGGDTHLHSDLQRRAATACVSLSRAAA